MTDTTSTNSLPGAHGHDGPKCPSCGQPLRLVKTTPGFCGLPERTYNCQFCGAVVTQDDGELVRTDTRRHLAAPVDTDIFGSAAFICTRSGPSR